MKDALLIADLTRKLERKVGKKEESPTFIDMGNTQVVGTDHLLNINEFPAAVSQLDTSLQRARNLIIEASSDILARVNRMVPNSVEAHAINSFLERGLRLNIHFLEENQDERRMAQESGFGVQLYFTLRFFYHVLDEFGETTNWSMRNQE